MSLHQSLRNHTADLHTRLDSGLDLSLICGSEDHLVGYLENFHQGLAASWAGINWGALNSLGLDETDARVSRYLLLSKDLTAWGSDLPPLPEGSSGSAAKATGIAYVLEGSMHGGCAIASQVAKKLGPEAFERVRFLRGFGDETSRYWARFLGWLGGLPGGDTFEAECCAAARWTFQNFIDIMQPADSQPKSIQL